MKKTKIPKLSVFTLPIPKEEIAKTATAERNQPVGILRNKNADTTPVFLFSPSFVRQLTEMEVTTFVERGAGTPRNFTDMDYASAGAELFDDAQNIIPISKILLKTEPFTLQEIATMQNGQILIAPFPLQAASKELLEIIAQKKINLFDYQRIRDKNKRSITEQIAAETANPQARRIAFEELLFSLAITLVMNKNLRHAIETHAGILQSCCCYNGALTCEEIGQKLRHPWKDIITLCWDCN